MKRILAATNNRGKLKEFGRILVPLGFEVVPYTDIIGKTEIEENGKSFEENSEIKARCIYDLSGEAVIADDSGLCVDALGGRPGVYSARYGGEDIPFEQKICFAGSLRVYLMTSVLHGLSVIYDISTVPGNLSMHRENARDI